MIDFLTAGLVLGCSAGFSPGPLLMLVISETLSHGTRSGVRVALSPIITDFPIVAATLLLLMKVSGYHGILGCVSLAGGLFVLYTGYQSLRAKPVQLDLPKDPPKSLRKGVVTNLLSPHPYLFWITVGAPLLSRSLKVGPAAFVAFIGSFYLCLVGAKIVLALAVGRSRAFMGSRVYLWIMRLLGALLTFFALLLFREGLKLLGVW
ncbi:LysE family translocator [Geomonas sp. Red69]|uniref:LysE family translocator n=1 Tax=Geomonas diazotrophica TaxID=2843197 RepID=A0ABX8JGK0_9BACT|nr:MULTISPECIES: LysE family translocator [Geomonas]MBU5637789.1 LysE family translocator [Geomonas diazotrophica]QWV96322.1 LysE family translocator [Geomonas nitrogeniifigens]QXE85389.1 LysE family translocator [Geomonas nitrogeniifigens]